MIPRRSPARSPRLQKQPDLFDHALRFGILRQRKMVLSRQSQETRAANAGGEFSTGLKRLYLIVAFVHDEGWYIDLGQQLGHVQVPGNLEKAVGAFSGGRVTLALGKSSKLFRRASGHK